MPTRRRTTKKTTKPKTDEATPQEPVMVSNTRKVSSRKRQEQVAEKQVATPAVIDPAAPPDDGPMDSMEDIEHLLEPDDPLPPIEEPSELPDVIQDAVEQAGWEKLRPVQRYSIPYVREKRDLMIQSRTGTGKTGGFILPMLEMVSPKVKGVQALVLVPTRELALQVSREAELLTKDSVIKPVSVYGGVDYKPQIRALKQGANLVIGTPGRILDHLMRRTFDLKPLKILVFDEADRMLSMGFYPDMRKVHAYLPGKQSGYMFSATFPQAVLSLADQFLKDPGFLSLSRDRVAVADTDHQFCIIDELDRDRALIRLIEMDNPSSAMIFCNRKTRVTYVATVLKRFGYDADLLTSDLSQKAREQVLKKIRDKKLRFLVATDVAARGIDIPLLSHVFQYDFPEDLEAYVHRSGRTGRAGASGTAITLVNAVEASQVKRLQQRYGIDMTERKTPSDHDVSEIVGQRLTSLLEARLRDCSNMERERLQRFIPLAESLADNEDERLLLALLLDAEYQDSLKTKVDLPDEDDVRESSPKKKRKKRSEKRDAVEKQEAASEESSEADKPARRSRRRRVEDEEPAPKKKRSAREARPAPAKKTTREPAPHVVAVNPDGTPPPRRKVGALRKRTEESEAPAVDKKAATRKKASTTRQRATKSTADKKETENKSRRKTTTSARSTASKKSASASKSASKSKSAAPRKKASATSSAKKSTTAKRTTRTRRTTKK
jgi:ATP-dependent RNA helicase DeaD